MCRRAISWGTKLVIYQENLEGFKGVNKIFICDRGRLTSTFTLINSIKHKKNTHLGDVIYHIFGISYDEWSLYI